MVGIGLAAGRAPLAAARSAPYSLTVPCRFGAEFLSRFGRLIRRSSSAYNQGVHTAPAFALSAFVITVSDSCARGKREDLSGPAVQHLLREHGFRVTGNRVVEDEQAGIEDALREAAKTGGLVVTTGGTGLTTRDVTPEATRAVCTRLLDGLSEQMRTAGLRETPFAVLSRGVCGLLGEALIVNLPGAPRGACTSLQAVLPVLPHALRLLKDAQAPHPVEPEKPNEPESAQGAAAGHTI